MEERQHNKTILRRAVRRRIGEKLRAQYESVVSERLPEHLVDLVARLEPPSDSAARL
jgi:hypothetical protein